MSNPRIEIRDLALGNTPLPAITISNDLHLVAGFEEIGTDLGQRLLLAPVNTAELSSDLPVAFLETSLGFFDDAEADAPESGQQISLAFLANAIFALGSARFRADKFDGTVLQAVPVRPGLIEARSIPRVIPAELADREDSGAQFPRVPDGLPDAWHTPVGRFTEEYETRAQAVVRELKKRDLQPEFWWAGSEDGEVIAAALSPSQNLLIDIEEPSTQDDLDAAIRDGKLGDWIDDEIRHLTED